MDRGDFGGGGGGTAVDGHDGMTVRPRAAPRARVPEVNFRPSGGGGTHRIFLYKAKDITNE